MDEHKFIQKIDITALAHLFVGQPHRLSSEDLKKAISNYEQIVQLLAAM